MQSYVCTVRKVQKKTGYMRWFQYSTKQTGQIAITKVNKSKQEISLMFDKYSWVT